MIELEANLVELEANRPISGFVLQFPGDTTDTSFVQLNCDKDYAIEIKLRKIRSRLSNIEQRQRAIAPKFNKPKDENWLLVLEQRSNNELAAMKRCTSVQLNRKTIERLIFTCPNVAGRYTYTLYFLSDCYLGLDQQFDIHIEAQNSEG